MISLRETKQRIESDLKHWAVYLMEFVDDFRYYKNFSALVEPLQLSNENWDALLASTAEYLCDELKIEPPKWMQEIPACKTPWFVSGMENLKAIAPVESPLRFRIQKIFVLENFLSRV